MYSDYHIHSEFSFDSSEKIENIIEKALNLNLKEIAFTEHLDYEHTCPEFSELDINNYFSILNNYKEIHKKNIDIKIGLELGVQPQLKEKLTQNLKDFQFDFIISSTHLVQKRDLFGAEYFINKTKDEAHEIYFKEILLNLDIYENFNVLGHFDFIKRYGGEKYREIDYKKHEYLIEIILKKLIDRNKGLEINTSGIRYGLNCTHPNFFILEKYKKFGGEIITIGSDAHKANDIGKDFKFAYDILEKLNIKYISSFNKQKVNFIKI